MIERMYEITQGSLVMYKGKMYIAHPGHTFALQEMSSQQATWFEGSGAYSHLLETLEGVLLDKEILNRLGIEKRFEDGNLWDFVNYEDKTLKMANRGQGHITLADFMESEGFFIELHSRRRLKFAHELQLLYMAKTGAKLEISGAVA